MSADSSTKTRPLPVSQLWILLAECPLESFHAFISVQVELKFGAGVLIFRQAGSLLGGKRLRIAACGDCRKETGFMINMSEKAEEVLRDYFKEKQISPIRVFLQTGG